MKFAHTCVERGCTSTCSGIHQEKENLAEDVDERAVDAFVFLHVSSVSLLIGNSTTQVKTSDSMYQTMTRLVTMKASLPVLSETVGTKQG